MAHEHIVQDTDAHFTIDKTTREISIKSGTNNIMQFDHNSERLTFELPKEIDSHDMTKCNVIQIHYINIDSSTKESNADVYEVTDMKVSPDDESKAVLSWLISRNATQFAGPLNFLVKFKCVATDGSVDYVWNTAVYRGLTVSNGMDNGEAVAEEYSDILANWEARISALEQGGGNGSNSGENADLTGVVKSVNGVTPDENGNVEIEAGGATDEQVEAAATAWLTRNAASLKGERGFGADHIVNDWPDPLEVYRRNGGHFVVPFGTEAVGGYLTASTGTITNSTYHSCWTAELAPGRSIEVAGFTGNTTYCFYDESEAFISGASVSPNTVSTVTPPENAKYIKVSAKTWSVKASTHSMPGVFYADAEYWSHLLPNPRSLLAKLNNPAYAHLNIVFSGDSNTAGAGLSDTTNSWCNLIGKKLQTLCNQQTVYRGFLVGANCKNADIGYGGGYIEFDFNGKELEVYCTSLASAQTTNFDVYVDGEMYQTITITGEARPVLTFPDYTRKRLKFCNNTSVHALAFRWTPVIEYTNVGLSGANATTIPTTGIKDCDLFIFMIGTNDRGGLHIDGGLPGGLNTIVNNKEKCIAILPPPRGYDEIMTNGKDSAVAETASWTSEAYIHATYVRAYSRHGITYIDISPEMAMESARHYQTMLQDDLLHFSEEGHKILANAISAKLGVPTYIKLEPVTTE